MKVGDVIVTSTNNKRKYIGEVLPNYNTYIKSSAPLWGEENFLKENEGYRDKYPYATMYYEDQKEDTPYGFFY